MAPTRPTSDLIGECSIQGQKLCPKPTVGSLGNNPWQCCDQFNFEPRFSELDPEYQYAKIWVVDVETAFQKKYGQPLPYPIDFFAYGETGLGIAVTKKANQYQLLNTEQGRQPKKLASIKCQLPPLDSPGPDRLARFLSDIPEYEIVKDKIWPLHTGHVVLLTYGSQIQLQSDFNQSFLATQEINYYQPLTGNQIQVMGLKSAPTDKSDRWVIKTQRRQGQLDSQGDGDETFQFGRPIKKW